MTSNLVKNMTNSDLLDMHYFLTEDDDLKVIDIPHLRTLAAIPVIAHKKIPVLFLFSFCH